MKQQVLVIHGGDSFKDYQEYLQNLKNKELSLGRIRPGWDWKETLQSDLGDQYDVLIPRFPCKENAKYTEWKIIFEKILEITDQELILIGHSLGGMFLIKYLSENNLDKNIKAVYIISSPYKKSEDEDRFAFTGDLESITKQTNNLFFIHSKDDVVVDFENLEKFKNNLPDANYLIFENRNHFFKPNSLPEIIDLIKNIK